MTTTDTITDKVAKLLRKAERAGTPEEADAFFAKAQELMTKYAIDSMAVHAKMNEGDKDPYGPLGRDYVAVTKSYGNADALLLQYVAKANDCRTLFDKHLAQSTLYGHEVDRINVQLLYSSLLMVAAKQALEYGRKSGLTGMPLYVARRSFREAFAIRIGARLDEARRAAFKAYEDMSSSSLLPMVQSKTDAVERYMPKPGKPRKSRRSYDPFAGAAGDRAARNADLGGPRLGGNTKGTLGR